MNAEQAINYLKSSGMSNEQIEDVINAIIVKDYVILTKEAYSDLCIRAAGLKSDFKEMLLDINFAIEDGDGFQLDEWLDKLEEMFETHEEGTETHGCVSKESETHE